MQGTLPLRLAEKKIEIRHSLLRAHTKSHGDAESIQKVAKTIPSTAFLANFWLIAGKSGFILQIFHEITRNTKAHVVLIEFEIITLRIILSIPGSDLEAEIQKAFYQRLFNF